MIRKSQQNSDRFTISVTIYHSSNKSTRKTLGIKVNNNEQNLQEGSLETQDLYQDLLKALEIYVSNIGFIKAHTRGRTKFS